MKKNRHFRPSTTVWTFRRMDCLTMKNNKRTSADGRVVNAECHTFYGNAAVEGMAQQKKLKPRKEINQFKQSTSSTPPTSPLLVYLLRFRITSSQVHAPFYSIASPASPFCSSVSGSFCSSSSSLSSASS